MGSRNAISRREALGLGLLGGLSLGMPPAARIARAAEATAGRARQARNIVFMVADGMSIAVPSLAELFSRTVRNTGTHW
ncbi:MAG: hypothetical protein JXO22_17995, partial [Phycisphaerae bacterium]|nr:hypothetical protein [Phycisphaerae bacterium]